MTTFIWRAVETSETEGGEAMICPKCGSEIDSREYEHTIERCLTVQLAQLKAQLDEDAKKLSRAVNQLRCTVECGDKAWRAIDGYDLFRDDWNQASNDSHALLADFAKEKL